MSTKPKNTGLNVAKDTIGVNMARIQFQVKSDRVSASLSGEALELANDLLDKVAPKTKAALVDYADEIVTFARSKWLVRAKNSKRSIDRLYTRFYITPDLQISAEIGNSARYSYAIKVGKKSESDLPVGRRLAIEALVKPSRKKLDRLVDSIADEIVRGLF